MAAGVAGSHAGSAAFCAKAGAASTSATNTTASAFMLSLYAGARASSPPAGVNIYPLVG